MTDKQILDLISSDKGREEGYRTLMTIYQANLYQHIRRIVIHHDDAKDVLQNTFIKVLRNIDKFKGQSGLYTWIYRIATNESLSYLKKEKRRNIQTGSIYMENGMERVIAGSPGPDPDKLQILLRDAVRTLPPRQRSVFSLRYFEEMSYREMAKVLDISEGSLKASFHHATRKIENYFKSVNVL